MSNIKQVHYDILPIKSKNCNYYLIYGEKSNGKSYQAKNNVALEDYLHKELYDYLHEGYRFILLRRWREDITNLWIEKYFSDVDIKKITNGKYNCISVYKKEIYFSNADDSGKVTRGEKIGYAMALSTEQHFSSGSFLDVRNIIFEEFMERGGMYLPKEPERLQTFYSTIDRKRGTTKMWLIGNTISRVCPYLTDWGLQPILRQMKQGEIKIVEMPIDEDNVVKIAIEYCKASGGKKMAFGNIGKMIDGGSWQTDRQPHLPKSIKDYASTLKIGFQYKGFRFVGVLLKDIKTKDFVWFIYPRQKEFSEKMLVFSDQIKQSQYWQRNIYNLTFENERLQKALSTFRESNIFYSDDLTGTDFKASIDFSIIK